MGTISCRGDGCETADRVEKMRVQMMWWICPLLSLVVLAACATSTDGGVGGSSTLCRSNSDCPVGTWCDHDHCVRARDGVDQDGGSDDADDDGDAGVSADTGTTDNGGEECLRASECPDGFDCLNNRCVSETADVGGDHNEPEVRVDLPESDLGPCEGRENGQLGDSCTGAADCCNGLCLGNVEAGRGYCTERCGVYDDCNPVGLPGDFFCMSFASDGYLCVASDYGQACENATNCAGGRCIKGAGTSACTFECSSGSQCPPGSGCGIVNIIYDDGSYDPVVVCAPVGTSCTVTGGFNDCVSGTCITPDEYTNTGFCSVFCNTRDPDACPAGFLCETQEGGVSVCVP